MPFEIPFGRRTFAPTWTTTLATLVLGILFVSLGRWQWHRAAEKELLWQRFAAGGEAAIAIGSRSLGEFDRYRRVALTGRYDTARQFLLDNRTHDGQPGYEVLTPFELADGRVILVDRGWIPFGGYRDRLPDVGFESASDVTITGRVDELPSVGLDSGRAAPSRDATWPKVASYPRPAQLATSLGRPVESRIVLLDATAANGYMRDWQPPGVPPDRHLSYALQWWSFAALLVGLYVFLNLRRTES